MHTFAESISRRNSTQIGTVDTLSPRQLLALECLVNRDPGETIEQVGQRAGVSRVTMHRYLKDPKFQQEYRQRVAIELASQRGRMAIALVRGGTTPGPGQAALQKIYWTMLGELRDTLEVTGKDGGPIDINVQQIPLHKLSEGALVKMLEILEAELGPVGQKLIGSGEASDVIDVSASAGANTNDSSILGLWGLQTVKSQLDANASEE